jgi:branched-subunit amino acid transport protein AzlD
MIVAASIFTEFWDRISDHDLQGLFLVLVGFILSFAFIRMSTRLMRSPKVPWWPGSIVSEGGVHLHHLVFGIVTMMIAGAAGFACFGSSPGTEICALLFGVGAGLTIDEFALWVYLDDVYWAEQGRSSIDATVIAAAGMMLVLLGFTPFTIEEGVSAVLGSVLSALVVFLLVAVCFAKGRVLHGSLGFFVFPVALYGACRLGKPDSAWARRRYGKRRPQKQARSEARFPSDRRTERFKNAFRDIVGGKPSEGLAAAREEALTATREASEEVRQRAERATHSADRERDS